MFPCDEPPLLHSRSVVPTTEDFDPALFMTVIHAAASFSDIRNGLESLDGAQANQVMTGVPTCVRSRLSDTVCTRVLRHARC